MPFTLSSPAFADGGEIPSRYTCSGEDISPPLHWSELPEGTRSLALIVDDPDAPNVTWIHWVAFNLPAAPDGLPEGFFDSSSQGGGTRQGVNDFGKLGYGGPCPPSGTHRYVFTLFALDRTLDLPEGCTKSDLLQKIRGHVLGEARLTGTYSRTRH